MAKIIACVMVLCMVALAAPYAQALTCTDVNTYMSACEPFLTETQGLLGTCCDGVKKLDGAATTTLDRQTACGCLKADGTAVGGIIWSKANLIPTLCGVSVPYVIDAEFDCSEVH